MSRSPAETRHQATFRDRHPGVLVAAAVVPVVLVVGVTRYPRSGPDRNPPTTGVAAVIPWQYQQIAARYAPQTQHLTVDCGGQNLLVAMLAAPGGAEHSPGPAGDALRAFFRNNPWAGVGTVATTNWALPAESPSRAIFGQRTGPIGVGTVVVFSRRGERFSPESETGCSTVHTGPSTIAEPAQLQKPLGHREILDDARVPATPVPLSP